MPIFVTPLVLVFSVLMLLFFGGDSLSDFNITSHRMNPLGFETLKRETMNRLPETLNHESSSYIQNSTFFQLEEHSYMINYETKRFHVSCLAMEKNISQ